MKFKLLLFSLLMSCGILSAQEAYRGLVISEARLTGQQQAYIEFTNMGTETIDLSEFELGKVTPWTGTVDVEGEWAIEDWFNVAEEEKMRLPAVQLAPGESYVVASVGDWRKEQFLIDPYENGYRPNKDDIDELADYSLHYAEDPAGGSSDSIDPKYPVLEIWNGRDCLYIMHHYTENDSAVIDQVGGVFEEENNTNSDGAYDVAGVVDATGSHVLVRKFTQKEGNINFANGRGVDLQDSEWIPIPNLGENDGRRMSFWTVGNHQNTILDENSLTSATVDVDWNNSTITVPWGTRRDDSLVTQFDKVDGLAWHYDYVKSFEDSAYLAARTGDSITFYALGDELQVKGFNIVVAEPTEDANIVVPKKGVNDEGFFGDWSAGPYAAFAQATRGAGAVDTIKNMNGIRGIGFATRVDTLLKYMQKPPNAEWEIVWVDDQERADLKDGDLLRVTAESGTIKDYYIWMEEYLPSHNANISSITWPDIPDFYRGIFGWMGDTIPNYVPENVNYRVQVPADVDGIPALVAKTADLNAIVEVKRATNLFAGVEDKTVRFTSTAEDDTSVMVYEIVLEKEKAPKDVQPYHAEPMISELIFWEQWSNGFLEIVNSGNQPMDLSDYMFFNGHENNPATAISGWADWDNRYNKYIPGYKWTSSEAEWEVQPHMAVQDLNVNPIVEPGDVFVMGHIATYNFANQYENNTGNEWWVPKQLDINFADDPWGENYSSGSSAARDWKNSNYYVFKILNDSVKQGLKPANDPNDFQLIETFGSGDGSDYAPYGVSAPMITSFVRKPQYFQPKPGFKESFADNPEDSEWSYTDRPYWQLRDVGWPMEILFVANGLGSHFMDEVTIYKSTVTSQFYKISPGYSHNESIEGVVNGTTVLQFMDNIIKADTAQTLTVKSAADGSVIDGGTVIADGDSLIVMSADSANISKYIITLGALSDDAVLTSATYDISVDGETGTIEGFDYGTLIRSIVQNITVPAGASMQVVDDEGAYVPLKRLNFDTTYVDVEVNDQTYIEVVAEDGVTKVVYQLVPNAEPSDAFVTSAVYSVDQEQSLISLVPEGTTVSGLLSNLTPARGATINIVDKLGGDRIMGNVFLDDKIVVTAADGETTRIYYLTMLDQEGGNLAYLLSDMFEVDQLTLTVYIVRNQTPTVGEVMADIELAPNATVMAMSGDGVEKADGDEIADGDILEVTAGNGLTSVEYTVNLEITSIDELSNNIKLYPNPSSGVVFIEGLEAGTRINVYNTVGTSIMDKVVQSSNEMISLENESSGLYFIVVTDDQDVVGRYKVIIE
jgi:hypothetical protein